MPGAGPGSGPGAPAPVEPEPAAEQEDYDYKMEPGWTDPGAAPGGPPGGDDDAQDYADDAQGLGPMAQMMQEENGNVLMPGGEGPDGGAEAAHKAVGAPPMPMRALSGNLSPNLSPRMGPMIAPSAIEQMQRDLIHNPKMAALKYSKSADDVEDERKLTELGMFGPEYAQIERFLRIMGCDDDECTFYVNRMRANNIRDDTLPRWDTKHERAMFKKIFPIETEYR